MNTNILAIARRGLFTIEGVPESVSGYTREQTWNGAACPFFEKEAADDIVEQVNASNMGDDPTLSYDSVKDAYIETYDGESSVYDAVTIQTVDGEKKVYAIGAWAWVWVEYDAEVTA